MNQTNGTVNDSVFERDEGIDEDNYEDTVEELRSRHGYFKLISTNCFLNFQMVKC